jgi:hypothetical protein
LVVGDSHGMAMLPAFEVLADKMRIPVDFASLHDCPPLLGIHLTRQLADVDRKCSEMQDRMLADLRQGRIKRLYLVARWSYYTDGDYYGRGQSPIGTRLDDPTTRERSRAVFAEALERTIAEASKSGVRVVIVAQIPMQRYDARDSYTKALRTDDPQRSLAELAVPVLMHRRLQGYVSSVFDRYRNDPRVRVVDADSAFCDQTSCQMGTMATSYYGDDNHLSAVGARFAADALISALAATVPVGWR